MADFAFWRCIFGSFQQNRINLYIKSYENRRFFGVFRRYGCIFYVFFCSISYWFTVFFVDFVVLICIYTKLRMQFWCFMLYVSYMWCTCICIVIEHVSVRVCIFCIYILLLTFNMQINREYIFKDLRFNFFWHD